MSDQLSKRYLHTGAAPVPPCASIQAQAAPREYPAVESAAAPVEVGHFAASWRGDWNSTIRGYAEEYARRANATLARQLAEARALAYVMPDDPEHGLLTWKERAYEESDRAEQAESALAAATRRVAEVEAYRDATFDGYAVYAELSDKARRRTSVENVADVLDALNRVARAAGEERTPPFAKVKPE